MAKQKKKRVDINSTAAPINDAFGGLSMEGLPSGPADVPAAPDAKANGLPRTLCLRRETAHRGGKTVVVVTAFPPGFPKDKVNALASDLKQLCGCGGTVKKGEVIIQGEKVAEVREYLEGQGVQVKGER